MSDISIDKLKLEVEGSADKAEKMLDKLISKLDKLTSSINNCTGMARIAKQIDKISVAINNASGISKIERLCDSLVKLQNIKAPNVTKTVNAINKLTAASNSIGNLSNLEQLKSNISAIAEACKPMENMGKNTLAPFLSSLKKLPEITNSLDTKTLETFAERIKQIAASITPLTNAVAKSQTGLSALNNIIRATTASNGNLAASNAAAVRSFTSLRGILSSVKIKAAAFVVIANKLGSVLSDCLDSSNAYVENLNLFSVSMGDAAQSAFEYAQQVNQLLGIDISDWIRNQGVFKQITSGFGVMTEKANLMSKNLTQIGYDIASFFNISVEDAIQKVQSGISGELEPLRRLGYALDAATLQQIAYNNGITQNINTMTQAQKSQLRYIAILQQSTNVMGDMARTIVTPANSIRILNQQIEQMKRALGNVVSVIAMKVIPYVQVAVRLLTDLGNWLANKMGFELPTIDYSGVSNGISSVTDSADEASEAVDDTVKKIQRLAGFDEINVLQSNNDDSSSSSNVPTNNMDLNVDLPEYDFLKDLNTQTDELYKKVKAQLKDLYKWFEKHKKIIKAISVLLAGLWVISKVNKFIQAIKNLWISFKALKGVKKIGEIINNALGFKNISKGWNSFKGVFKTSLASGNGFFKSLSQAGQAFRNQLSGVQQVLGTIVGAAVASYGSYNLFKSLATDTQTWYSVLGNSAEIVGGLATSWLFGGGKGLAVAAISTAVSALAGYLNGVKENADKALDRLLASEWNTGGVSIKQVADNISSYCKALTETESTYNDACAGLNNIKETAEKTNTSLGNFLKTLSPENWDTEAMQTVQQQFKSLVDNTKQYSDDSISALQTYVNSNKDFIEAVGGDVERLNTILKNAKSNADDKITQIKKKIDSLTSKNTLSESEISTLQSLREQLADMMGIDVGVTADSLKNLRTEAKTLAEQDINLENLDTMKTAISNIGGSLAESVDDIKTAKENLFKQIDQLEIDAKEKNYMKNVFGEMFKVKEQDLADIQKSLNDGVIKKVNDTIDQGLEDIKNNHLEGFGSYVVDNLFGGNVSESEVREKQDAWLESIGIPRNGAGNFLKDAMLKGGMTITDYENIFNASSAVKSVKKVYNDISNNKELAKAKEEAQKSILGLNIQSRKQVLKDIKDMSEEQGYYYVIGYANELKKTSNLTDVQNAAKKYSENAVAALKEGQDSHSPSKKTQNEGINFVQGYIDGMKSLASSLKNQAKSIAEKAVSTLKSYTNTTSIGKSFVNNFATGIMDNISLATKQSNDLGKRCKNSLSASTYSYGKDFVDNFKKGINDTKSSAVNAVVDMFNAILGKLDSFNVKFMNTLNSAIPSFNSVFSSINATKIPAISYTAPAYRVQGYAQGGFPKKYQLFTARENGIPEMVGKVGNRTAVANNGQIEEGIARAVLKAMQEADTGGDIYVTVPTYVDGNVVNESQYKYNQRQLMRSNGRR